jgi:hypothetical protein
MPRPGGGSIGHSKHRKAFGSKHHKSGFNRIRKQKDNDREEAERKRIKDSRQNPMTPIRDLFNP